MGAKTLTIKQFFMIHLLDTLVGNARRALHRPHRHLARRLDWYARWHDHPASNHSHGTIAVGFMLVAGTLLTQVTTNLRSEIVPATPTVERPSAPAGQERPEPVRRPCGERTIVTDTIGTERSPIRFKDPVRHDRWVLTLSLVRPAARADQAPDPRSVSVRSRDGQIDCADARQVPATPVVAVDLSGMRIDPDCTRCNLDGVRTRYGSATLEGQDTLVVATGNGQTYGQWTLRGIRVHKVVPTDDPAYELGAEDWVVLTLVSTG